MRGVLDYLFIPELIYTDVSMQRLKTVVNFVAIVFIMELIEFTVDFLPNILK